MDEPKSFVAGDTVEWEKSLADYPASEWTLTYYFWNESKDFSVVASADGDNYQITIPAATSEDYTAGTYNWKAIVSQGSEETLERHTVASGQIIIRHNPAAGEGSGIDSRSAVKIALDAIEAVIAGRASKDQESYSIAGRSLSRTPMADLIMLRTHYAKLYAKEQQEDRIEQGLGGKKIHIRFT
jgi:hypothetical protein